MKYAVDIILAIIYLIGVFLIPKWHQKKRKTNWKFYELLWFSLCFIIYVIYLEVRLKRFYFLIPLSLLILFLFSYLKEKRRLINGLLFNIFFFAGMIYLGVILILTLNPLLFVLAGVSGIFIIFLIVFGIYALVVFLYWNAVVVMRKEGHSLANLLTLILAIALTFVLIINFTYTRFLPDWLIVVFSFLPILMNYYFIVFYNFLTISIIYQFNQPKYDQDFIIVLGSGLINGSIVPPLLAKRIDKAISFYEEQRKATGKTAKLIMSGGQGSDEQVAEGVAMKEYAIQKGIPESQILVESESKNTFENMKFSKIIMDRISGNETYHAIFTTNNYHLFRAGLFAKMANLKADGIGAHTAFYFLPNAFLREFIAVIMMHKKRHIMVSSLLVICLFLLILVLFLAK